MIDMHSHCLPGVDDGAKDISEALEMLEDAYEKGCDMVVATPHCRVYSDEELNKAVLKRDKAYKMLKEEALKRGSCIPSVIKGFEVYLDKDITAFPSFAKLCIEGTKAMLVEMPMHHWDGFAMDRIEALKRNGIVPVIAHIDRYIRFNKNIEKALRLENVVYQINPGTFFSFKKMRLVKKLLKMGKIVVAGSDMHNMDERKSRLYEAYKKAAKKSSDHEAMFITSLSQFKDKIYLA